MKKENKVDILDIFENYGHYTCNIGSKMDEVGISVSKMKRLTGLNYEIVKKYYEDSIIRIDKDVFARITYILIAYGINPQDLISYVPPAKKM